MTENQRRSARLVRNIRAALERGVRADRIHAELVRRNMSPEKAALLLDRILWSMIQSTGGPLLPDTATPPHTAAEHPSPHPVHQGSDPAAPPEAPHAGQRRRTRAPFFLALAGLLLVGGFAGVYLNAQEAAARRDREAAELAALAARLDGDVASAREHLTYLDTLMEARRTDAEQIEWLRARIARGPRSFETIDDYNAMVARYQRRREQWNRALPDYQVVAQAFRMLADIHNAKADTLDALRPRLPTAAAPSDAGPVRRVRIATAAGSM